MTSTHLRQRSWKATLRKLLRSSHAPPSPSGSDQRSCECTAACPHASETSSGADPNPGSLHTVRLRPQPGGTSPGPAGGTGGLGSLGEERKGWKAEWAGGVDVEAEGAEGTFPDVGEGLSRASALLTHGAGQPAPEGAVWEAWAWGGC